MPFSASQTRALADDLDPTVIQSRQCNGRELSYIEGWHAISEANRIFGFDGWCRETIESRCIFGKEIRGTFHAAYLVKVRITVHAKGTDVHRESFGTGEADAESIGEAHDRALKSAETDATKRALATFGKPFGLSLYIRKSSSSANPKHQAAPKGQTQKLKDATAPDAPFVAQASPLPAPRSDSAATRPKTSHAEVIVHGEQRVANLDALLINRPQRKRDLEHLRFVASQPCLLCGRTPSDAHHLRFAQPQAMSRKVSDEFTVPLCRTHHRQLHQSGNEVEWWTDMDIDALSIANGLWEEFRGKNAASL